MTRRKKDTMPEPSPSVPNAPVYIYCGVCGMKERLTDGDVYREDSTIVSRTVETSTQVQSKKVDSLGRVVVTPTEATDPLCRHCMKRILRNAYAAITGALR